MLEDIQLLQHGIANSNDLLDLLVNKVLSWVAKNDYTDWQVNVACNRANLVSYSSLREAILQCILIMLENKSISL